MRTITTLLFILFHQFSHAFSLVGDSQQVDTVSLTLSQAWEKAEVYSREIQLQRKSTAIALEEYKDAKLELFPEVSIKGTAEKASNIPIYVNGIFSKPEQHEVIHNLYHVGAEFYQVLYHGNKYRLSIQENKILYALGMIAEDKKVSDIRFKTSCLYLELQRSLLFKDLIIEDIEDQKLQLKEVKEFYNNGTVLKSDVLRIELDLSKRKMALVSINNDLLLIMQKLNIIFGEPDDQIIKPVEILPLGKEMLTYQQCIESALLHSFDYHISEKQTEISAIKLKSVKANVRPNIGLYGEFYYANPQIFLVPYNPNWYSLGVVGVKATFALSSFYHNIHKERAARVEFEKEEIAHHHTADLVRQRVKEAYLRYEEAIQQIDVSNANVIQAAENARIIKNTYFNHSALITDLLDADIQLLQSRFELASAQILAQEKYYLLQNVLGVL